MRLSHTVRLPRMATAVGAAVCVWGLAIGLLRLHDNSFLTHVATGRLILAHGFPTRDPYSFTAHGDPWVVESWFASVCYGVIDRAAGGHGLQVLHAALAAALAGLVWLLTRPAQTLVGRILAAAMVLAVGTGYWTPRPLLIALVLFAVVVVMTESDLWSPWVLVPVMWLWVNVHGSWPLALGYLLIRGCGRLADRRAFGRIPWLAAAVTFGTFLGAVNPYGLRLLTYPLVTLTHHQAFAHIVEWQSPSFANPVNAIFLAQVLVALILLVVRRGSIEDALVVSLFAASAMFASRNVPLATIVTAPVLARSLAGLGSFAGVRRTAVSAAALSAVCGLGAMLVASALQRPAYDLSAYPVSEVSWMQRHGIGPARVAAPDYVGNYLEFRFGVGAKVLIDDRVDMFPSSVQRAYTTLLAGSAGWQAALRGPYRPSAVLWPRNEPLAGLVAEDPHWRVVLKDRRWIVALPVTSPVTVVRVPT